MSKRIEKLEKYEIRKIKHLKGGTSTSGKPGASTSGQPGASATILL